LGIAHPALYIAGMLTTLGERIKQVRLLRGIDQTQFGELVGATQSTVARWERGSQPKPDALRKIADLANMSVDTLLGVTPPTVEVEGHEVRWVPLIGLAPASSWRDAVEMPMGEVPVKASKAGRRAFGVEIKGDSMDKLLAEGGWAIVDPDQTNLYDNKVYLVANLEHEVTLKRYKSNPARLEPMSHNPEHEVMMIVPHKINVLGRIVAYGNDDGL
jgi:repressor LexA